MVELGNQQVLFLLQRLALGDVARQALDAQESACGVKFALCRLLQPYLSTVRTDKAETQGIRRIARSKFADARLEARAVVGMDVPEEIVARQTGRAALFKSKNVDGVVVAL